MRATIVVLLACLCVSPVWMKPAATEPGVTSRNAQDVLDMIEQSLTFVVSENQGSHSRKGVDSQREMAPSEWPWIDSLLNIYSQSGIAPVNVSEGVVSIILQHYAISEHFREAVVREFASSKAFLNFTLQEFPIVKEGLLQWFITSEEFRKNVLKDITCSEVSKLLKLFSSSMPTRSSGTSTKQFSEEEPFVWKVLEKWSENECFKSALLERLVLSKSFKSRIESRLSNSEAFSEAVIVGFIGSQYFTKSLVVEYVKSEHLLEKLLYQFQHAEKFRKYLLTDFVEDVSFRQAVFHYLSSMEFDLTKLEFKGMVLKRAVKSEQFRTAIFLQILAAPDFKEAVLEAFSSVQQFRFAMVHVFANSDGFKREVNDSQAMLRDAMELFEESESFRNAVLKTKTVHVRM